MVGRIAVAYDASEVGCFVEVVDDTDGATGGAFIHGWTEAGEGWDAWVEAIEDIDVYAEESGWQVEWFDHVPSEALAGRPSRP